MALDKDIEDLPIEKLGLRKAVVRKFKYRNTVELCGDLMFFPKEYLKKTLRYNKVWIAETEKIFSDHGIVLPTMEELEQISDTANKYDDCWYRPGFRIGLSLHVGNTRLHKNIQKIYSTLDKVAAAYLHQGIARGLLWQGYLFDADQSFHPSSEKDNPFLELRKLPFPCTLPCQSKCYKEGEDPLGKYYLIPKKP